MSSSLQQLINAGILEPDFAELDGCMPEQRPDSPDLHVSHVTEPTVSYMSRSQPDSVSGWKPLYQSTPEPSPEPSPEPEPELETAYYRTVAYHWLYSSPSYGWWHFSKDDNDKLEKWYRSGQHMASLYICGNCYTIDFTQMTQKGNGKPRHLLRTTILGDIVLKGVAGSRILKNDILKPTDVCNFNTLSSEPGPSSESESEHETEPEPSSESESESESEHEPEHEPEPEPEPSSESEPVKPLYSPICVCVPQSRDPYVIYCSRCDGSVLTDMSERRAIEREHRI